MFEAAFGCARDFTRPVLMTDPGSASKPRCGSFIVVNRSGWIITARHILEDERDGSGSFVWGWEGVSVDDVLFDSESDIAVGRLTPFDGDWVTDYPAFSNSGKALMGMTVGRIGYNMDRGDDAASAGAFGNCGIVSQEFSESGTRMFVTSTPGISGQSGGAVFDRDGVIFGMQVATRLTDTGYRYINDDGAAATMTSCEGIAVHVDSMRRLMDAAGIPYRIGRPPRSSMVYSSSESSKPYLMFFESRNSLMVFT
ncbi:MAG: trypsin-like peptidase domain-containing protein [Candidatus Methanomethylophilaceae archaeon]|nr:trypsin-like peptidase domain-containing protein [Candidatus Methanomethylophilaceae archaeon]